MKAVEVLIEHGVPEERIIFINLVSLPRYCAVDIHQPPSKIASPEGLTTFCAKYPQLKVVSRPQLPSGITT